MNSTDNNRKQNTRLLVLTLVLVVALLFGIIVWFINIGFEGDDTEVVPRDVLEYRKKREDNMERLLNGDIVTKYKSSLLTDEYIMLNYDERDEIDEKIDSVLSLINGGDCDKIYSKLMNEYKQSRFPSVEDFKDFYKEKIEGLAIKCAGYTLSDGIVYADIHKGSGDKSLDISSIRINDFLSSDDKYNFAFNNYISNTPIRAVYKSSTVGIVSDNILNYGENWSIVLRLNNHLDKEVTVNFDGTKIVAVYGQNNKMEKTVYSGNTITLPAKSKKYVELFFGKLSSKPEMIYLDMTVDGSKIQDTIHITQSSYDVDEM
jgi:hypothetical protein